MSQNFWYTRYTEISMCNKEWGASFKEQRKQIDALKAQLEQKNKIIQEKHEIIQQKEETIHDAIHDIVGQPKWAPNLEFTDF